MLFDALCGEEYHIDSLNHWLAPSGWDASKSYNGTGQNFEETKKLVQHYRNQLLFFPPHKKLEAHLYSVILHDTQDTKQYLPVFLYRHLLCSLVNPKQLYMN